MTRLTGRRRSNRPAGFRSGPFRIGFRVNNRKELIMRIVRFIKQFTRDEEGVTAIEYGLIAALIAVTIIAAVTIVGDNLVLVFTAISDALAAAL
jgi:pilus assembly protein Flp/PilA